MLARSRFVPVAAIAFALAGCPGSDTYVVDQPAVGQALITGTIQTIRWHGGSPSDTVDIRFVPWSGAAVTLAAEAPNNGRADVQVHLLGDEVRRGGRIRIERARAARQQALDGLDGGNTAEPGAPGAVKVGSLAGFSWNGSSEDYYWLDVLSGEKKVVGTVGDLEYWTFKTLAIDPAAERIYVLGFNKAMQQKLYVLDTKSGALVRDVAVSGGSATFSGLNLLKGGALVAFFWNDAMSREEMVRIDTQTGAVATLGVVGDLQYWSNETAYDAVSDTIYVIGEADMGTALKLYVLDGTSGQLRGTMPLTAKGAALDDLLGVLVTSTGDLIGFRWNGTAEEMLRVNPATGEGTAIGTVGDLQLWSSIARINLTTDVIYVIGLDASMQSKLYALDGKSGVLLYDTRVQDFPTNAVLVY